MQSPKRFSSSARSALLLSALAIGSLAISSAHAATGLAISEWMYNPLSTGGEFVEFTNFGPTAIDLTGWKFDDSSRNSPTTEGDSLSAFGIVAPGESIIITELSTATFRSQWGLGASVKIVGGITNNLGRADEINLYNASAVLVDRLTYDDQGTGSVKGPRTQGVSGRPTNVNVIGANTASQWVLSSVGDVEGSYTSSAGDIGSPGKSVYAAAIPEPSAYAAMIGGIGMLALGARRRR